MKERARHCVAARGRTDEEGGGSAYHKHWRVVVVRKSDCTLSKEISGCYAVLFGNRILSLVQWQERVQQILVEGIAFVNLNIARNFQKDACLLLRMQVPRGGPRHSAFYDSLLTVGQRPGCPKGIPHKFFARTANGILQQSLRRLTFEAFL